MTGTNGAGQAPTVLGARRRVSAVPKTILFDVETVSDEVVTMVGYCKGRADGYGPCPTSVTIEADLAYRLLTDASWLPATPEEIAAWEKRCGEALESGEDIGQSPIADDGTVYHYNRQAEIIFRRDMLIATIPALGSNPEAASVLAGDDGDWLDMLRDLGWWRQATPEEMADPQPAGEDAASAPDGSSSSPMSAQPLGSGQTPS